MLVENGQVKADGPVEKIVQNYLNTKSANPAFSTWPAEAGPGDEVARLRSVRVIDESGRTAHAVDIRRPVGLEMGYDVLAGGHQLVAYLHLFNAEGVCVLVAGDRAEFGPPTSIARTIPLDRLATGQLFS